MNQEINCRKFEWAIVLSLFMYHLLLIGLGIYVLLQYRKEEFYNIEPIWIHVIFLGIVGGFMYCVRSLYVHYCVKKDWNSRWIVWYIIRPFASSVCGALSLLFINAGFLLFEVSTTDNAVHTNYGIYAFAFIAGWNVDNFIQRMEGFCNELFGLRKPDSSKDKEVN